MYVCIYIYIYIYIYIHVYDLGSRAPEQNPQGGRTRESTGFTAMYCSAAIAHHGRIGEMKKSRDINNPSQTAGTNLGAEKITFTILGGFLIMIIALWAPKPYSN